MASTATEIDSLLRIIENRAVNFGNVKGDDVIAQAILLHAKVVREVANEIMVTMDEMKRYVATGW
jgi:hypothetical protein